MIDSGATGNFISSRWVIKHQTPVILYEKATSVSFADNSTKYCTQFIKNAVINLEDSEVIQDLDVLNMNQYEVILGKPWLKEANPRIN